jgi:soluble lytic murein transglycosylase-like protein
MRRSIVAVMAVAIALPACAGDGADRATPSDPWTNAATTLAGAATGPSGAGSPSPVADAPPPTIPEPDAWIPLRAGPLAARLEATREARREAVRRWVRTGDPDAWPPPEDVELLVLYEQRIYRVLAARDRLAVAVLNRLDHPPAPEARSNVRAGGALYDHFSPLKTLPDFRTHAPDPADQLLRYFEEGERRFGVDWELLAAVMLIETRMGRIASSSSAGAQGPMQFLPSTWEVYGLGGDIRDEHDAILGAANYLSASGSPADDRGALFHYNPVPAYVTAVTAYAKAMSRDRDLFYAYYNWQVFVRTRHGDVRLTGPGL